MAIQTRRGIYDDFDPAKMLPGELATVTAGDPGANDGRSVYACFAAGDVKRMATYEDMEENIDQATQDVQEAFSAQLTQKISQADTAISQAQTATSAANTAAQGADEAKQEALDAAEEAKSYVLGDISNKTVSFSEASTRGNINTGESTATLFGKIKKWFSDLGAAAFHAVANNLSTNAEGSVLDARQGKVLGDAINQLNTKTNRILVDRPLITQSPLNGSAIGTYAERVVTGLQNFAEVRMFVAIGDAALQWLAFDTHQATQTVTVYYSDRYTASAEFKCDLSTGTIGVNVRSATGWAANQCGIRMVIGILAKS